VKNFAFPQQLLPHVRAHFKTVPATGPAVPITHAPELSPRLLGDLALLCRRESIRAKTVDDYTHLNWIAADLDRRWRKATGK
jgi:hypothetical protein